MASSIRTTLRLLPVGVVVLSVLFSAFLDASPNGFASAQWYVNMTNASAIQHMSITAVTQTQHSVDILFHGTESGDQVFLMHTNVGRNCSEPPPSYTKEISQVRVLTASQATFWVSDLRPGRYTVCYKSIRSGIDSPFVDQEDVTFTISGAIDTSKSTACCVGPFVVGNHTYCEIYAYDSEGYPAGSADDTCDFSYCPVTDGLGVDIGSTIGKPAFVRAGLFRFSFIATGAGDKGSLAVSYSGSILSNQITYFTLLPGPAVSDTATSECHIDASGEVVCDVTLRDQYSNAVKKCTSIEGFASCTPS